MTLWRVLLRVAPSPGKRKSTVHEYAVLAPDKVVAEGKAIEQYRPSTHEKWTIEAESWDTDVVLRRIYLD